MDKYSQEHFVVDSLVVGVVVVVVVGLAVDVRGGHGLVSTSILHVELQNAM